jgi:hypothetical protein
VTCARLLYAWKGGAAGKKGGGVAETQELDLHAEPF